jgi:formyltetrahydrofolate deformylase
MPETTKPSATPFVMTLTCPDQPGIVHAVCSALLEVGGNITDNAQFSEPDTGTFCMRTAFDATETDPAAIESVVRRHLGTDIERLRVRTAAWRPRVLIMVSKFDHCLVDLLYRWRTGGLDIDIPVIVSNHPDCALVAASAGIRYVHLPMTAATKAQQERALMDIIEESSIDLVVLARYMQVLSDDLCRFLEGRAMNIHHSFLPGFKGAKPYHQAHERGVKLVGATAHFVTAELDEGPIIEQDVARVTHGHTVDDLVRLGQDTERAVLSRAVRAWAEDRVLLVGSKTVVFS